MSDEIQILNMCNTHIVPDLCVRIDRKSKWRNPYKMNSESERLEM